MQLEQYFPSKIVLCVYVKHIEIIIWHLADTIRTSSTTFKHNCANSAVLPRVATIPLWVLSIYSKNILTKWTTLLNYINVHRKGENERGGAIIVNTHFDTKIE